VNRRVLACCLGKLSVMGVILPPADHASLTA